MRRETIANFAKHTFFTDNNSQRWLSSYFHAQKYKFGGRTVNHKYFFLDSITIEIPIQLKV